MPLIQLTPHMSARVHSFESLQDSESSLFEDSPDLSEYSQTQSEYSQTQSEYSPNLSQIPLSQTSEDVITMEHSLSYIKCYPKGDPETIDSEVKRFFYAVFEVCTSNMVLTKEEQERIGPLIKNAILDMDDCLKDIGDNFDGDYGPEALILRSGYQFMVDNFKNFSDGNGNTLKNAFEYFQNTQSIDTLDKSLARWKERPYICEEDIHHTAEELNRPENVPESHHWWFQST